MLCMREARLRTFMQLELEACQEEIVWMITCHNCEALNRPLEEYLARTLPIPPNYIDNLHSNIIYPSATTRPRVAVPGETNLSTQVTTDTAVA